MERRDYLLIEIEKIGLILSAIRMKFFGGPDDLAISIQQQIVELREEFLGEIGFELDKFMSLNKEQSNEYISNFKGFSVENIELLADTLSQIGSADKKGDSKKYTEKAHQLYELCNLKSKTFSIDREIKINS